MEFPLGSKKGVEVKRRLQLQYEGPSSKNITTSRQKQTKSLSSPAAQVAEDSCGRAQEQSKHTVILTHKYMYFVAACGLGTS